MRRPEPLAVVDRLYRAAADPSLWPDALDSLAKAVGGIGAVMIPITPDERSTVVSPAMREAAAEYEKGWWRYDTRVLRIHARGLTRGVVAEADLFNDEDLARDPFRQEFCRGFAFGAFASQLCAPLPQYTVAFTIQRALNKGAFERTELDNLRLLGEHASRAAMLGHQLGNDTAALKGLGTAVSRMQCGALLLDSNGRVLFANEAAESLMGDGFSIVQGSLRAARPCDQLVLDRHIAGAAAGLRDAPETNHDGPVRLARASGKRPLLAQAVPVPSSLPFHSPAQESRGAVLVCIVDPDARAQRSPVASLRALGLSAAEARIASLIGSGRSRREAAEALGISEWTVRDTLKVAYAKLGISRQSELVRLVERCALF